MSDDNKETKKTYQCNKNLINSISDGCQKMADNVGSTMGPKGKNVILRREKQSPVITKDGVTVASFIDLENEFEDLGAQVIKQSAIETNKKAGDGTTTATIIANSIYQKSVKYLLTDTIAPKSLKNGIQKLKPQILEYLDDKKVPVRSKEDIKHIATISSNGDESIGDMISLSVDKVGKDGSIIIKESGRTDTVVDFVEGYQFGRGYTSSKFINDERNKKVYYDKETLIFVTDHHIEDVTQMMPVLEKVAEDGRPLLMVSSEIKDQAHAALIMNSERGTMDVVSVNAPFYGERRSNFLEDLAVTVGANFISAETGDNLSTVSFDDLGVCNSIEITQNKTTIVGGKGDKSKINRRIDGIKKEIEREDNLDEAEKKQDRVARLSSGVAVIQVGASTKVELDEKKHRVEDALEAVKSAQEEGILPGGGTALLRASRELDLSGLGEDERQGARILKDALEAPVRVMSQNANDSPDVLVNKILDESRSQYGYDFITQEITDLLQSGIIDPKKVTRNAFENAVSSAATLLMSSNAIVEK